MKFSFKRSGKRLAIAGIFIAAAYFFPIPVSIFVLCGIYDVSRNRGLDASVIRQYFFRNGITTWFASPLNIVLDILALPYLNKGVYQLEDLPLAYQEEIGSLMKVADESNLVSLLERHTTGLSRAMFFFKWYGKNVENSIDVPAFRSEYRYIRTIGVSMFKERESTSRHFGPFRPSLRVLYCINKIKDEHSYIKVGPVENHWRDNRLFIFDDTLLHQSFNDTDEPRYVLFVDILRPSYMPFFFSSVVSIFRIIFKSVNGIFYKNWKLVNN